MEALLWPRQQHEILGMNRRHTTPLTERHDRSRTRLWALMEFVRRHGPWTDASVPQLSFVDSCSCHLCLRTGLLQMQMEHRLSIEGFRAYLVERVTERRQTTEFFFLDMGHMWHRTY